MPRGPGRKGARGAKGHSVTTAPPFTCSAAGELLTFLSFLCSARAGDSAAPPTLPPRGLPLRLTAGFAPGASQRSLWGIILQPKSAQQGWGMRSVFCVLPLPILWCAPFQHSASWGAPWNVAVTIFWHRRSCYFESPLLSFFLSKFICSSCGS